VIFVRRSTTSSRFDAAVEELRASVLSVDEAEVLEAHLWSRGDDGFLREDVRFRKTPWGRWVLSSRFLVNDEVVRRLRSSATGDAKLADLLAEIASQVGCEASICGADPRLVLRDERVRLSAAELSDDVVAGDAAADEKFKTHLPLHTLKAVAASQPRHEWGPGAQEESIETIGWVRVDAKKKLNERMFVAEIHGHSMDDGKSGLVDGGYGIFELWPAGTKQDLVVLARGAFSDPETGAFAVKKYKADARGVDGTHQSIRLVSLNHDKDRFPDIVLTPERDDDVTVVAKLVAPLARSALPRKPLAGAKVAGRRDTGSETGRRAIAAHLQALAQSLLQPTTPKPAGTRPKALAARAAELVCFDDHLALEVGPAPLPPFAKQLRVMGDHDDVAVIGANVRTARRRIRVSPSQAPWTWQAPTLDADELADELAALAVEGLPADRATVFRVDAAGVGRRRASPVLTPGERWRILVPPALPGDGLAFSHGWKLVELELGASIPADIAASLDAWGLQVRPAHPRVLTLGARPIRWQETANGEQVPTYAQLSEIAVAIDGMSTLFPGELTAFLASPSSSTHLALPVGAHWFLAVEEATDGGYCVEATPTRTASDVERACFNIEDAAPTLPTAALTLCRGSDVHAVDADGRLQILESFAQVMANHEQLSVQGPPLWPVRLRVEAPGYRGTKSTALDEDGVLDVREVLESWRSVWEDRPFADLTIDAADLGVIVVQHRANRTVASIVEALAALVSEREKALPQLRGDLALYDDQWVKPLLKLFGYEIQAVPPAELADAPAGARAYLLYEWRTDETPPRRELSRICVVVSGREALDPLFIGGAHAFADKLLARHHVRESMITDGLQWSEHRRGSSLRRPTFWDVVALGRERSTHKIEQLLNELAVGV
jgi:hypothetical protein